MKQLSLGMKHNQELGMYQEPLLTTEVRVQLHLLTKQRIDESIKIHSNSIHSEHLSCLWC